MRVNSPRSEAPTSEDFHAKGSLGLEVRPTGLYYRATAAAFCPRFQRQSQLLIIVFAASALLFTLRTCANLYNRKAWHLQMDQIRRLLYNGWAIARYTQATGAGSGDDSNDDSLMNNLDVDLHETR